MQLYDRSWIRLVSVDRPRIEAFERLGILERSWSR